MQPTDSIRNIAIIAHVDHGKTTLVDGLLKQSNTFRDNQAEMAQQLLMDSGDQEKERGITITAKITSVHYDRYKINIVDTPGHADFSGEVERTLNLADGCLLIVDAQEGPMPQTKFVLSKALEAGLKTIVVINKIDKPGRRIEAVEDELSNVFLETASHEDQLHYPIFYAIGRDGKAWSDMPEDASIEGSLECIFKAIIDYIPAPENNEGPLQMQVTALDWDSFKGKYAIGRVRRGQVNAKESVLLLKADGSQLKGKIETVSVVEGLQRKETPTAACGDIVLLTGVGDARIGDTICEVDHPEPMPPITIADPTLKIYLGPNTSPLKGTEGDFTTGRQIGDRLAKELETNVGLKVEPSGIGFLVSGRGELHLSVLIESMRRDGFELEVGRPEVITKTDEQGHVTEPVEALTIEVPPEHAGTVQMELGRRKALLLEQTNTDKGSVMLRYRIPTRTLLGLRNNLLTATRGTLVMHSLMEGYEPLGSPLQRLRNGVLVAWEGGTTTPYALQTAEERGVCLVPPGVVVYQGQLVGINNRQEDMDINVCKAKHLTNMRSKSSDGVVQLTPHLDLSLEQCLDFIESDELLEVTPKNLRLRKRELDPTKRKRLTRR